MPTLSDTISALRGALKAGPAPGPWYATSQDDYATGEVSADPMGIRNVAMTFSEEAKANAALIAAANPEAITLILDALEEAQRKVAGWQPIETAPKDGTELLLWRHDCGQFIGSYTSGDSFPLTQDEIDMMAEEVLFQKDWFTQWPDARRLEGCEIPTGWMPLPPPPEPSLSADLPLDAALRECGDEQGERT